jgi:hypothetical protein
VVWLARGARRTAHFGALEGVVQTASSKLDSTHSAVRSSPGRGNSSALGCNAPRTVGCPSNQSIAQSNAPRAFGSAPARGVTIGLVEASRSLGLVTRSPSVRRQNRRAGSQRQELSLSAETVADRHGRAPDARRRELKSAALGKLLDVSPEAGRSGASCLEGHGRSRRIGIRYRQAPTVALVGRRASAYPALRRRTPQIIGARARGGRREG